MFRVTGEGEVEVEVDGEMEERLVRLENVGSLGWIRERMGFDAEKVVVVVDGWEAVLGNGSETVEEANVEGTEGDS